MLQHIKGLNQLNADNDSEAVEDIIANEFRQAARYMEVDPCEVAAVKDDLIQAIFDDLVADTVAAMEHWPGL